MVSNIRTNSSGLISTPLVAVVVPHDQNPDRIANAEKSLKKSRSESLQCDAGKIVTASAPACCAQFARRVVFTVVGDTPES